jgi:hypothetical protein
VFGIPKVRPTETKGRLEAAVGGGRHCCPRLFCEVSGQFTGVRNLLDEIVVEGKLLNGTFLELVFPSRKANASFMRSTLNIKRAA